MTRKPRRTDAPSVRRPRRRSLGYLIPWPDPAQRGIHAAKWQVLIGNMLRVTREGRGLSQASVAAALGIAQTALSRAERGLRRLDVIEFAYFLGLCEQGPERFAVLIRQPTQSAWDVVRSRREPDERFSEAPVWPPSFT